MAGYVFHYVTTFVGDVPEVLELLSTLTFPSNSLAVKRTRDQESFDESDNDEADSEQGEPVDGELSERYTENLIQRSLSRQSKHDPVHLTRACP